MQYGTAAKIPCTGGWRSRQAFQRFSDGLRLAGRLTISAWPRITATWRDRIAVGTKRRPICRICSPKPGISLSATASVASGVTSRGAGPVPRWSAPDGNARRPPARTAWH